MNSKTNLTQPKIRRYLHILHHLDHFGMYTQRFDEKSLVLLDDFFKLIEQITPISENGTRSVWLTAPRGTFDDFGVTNDIGANENDNSIHKELAKQFIAFSDSRQAAAFYASAGI